MHSDDVTLYQARVIASYFTCVDFTHIPGSTAYCMAYMD